MEKVEELSEQDAIDKIMEVFKDGDSVVINCRTEVNTYSKKLDYLINQIYIEKEPIDFNSDDFEEVNELKTPIIITEKPSGKKVKAGMVNYQGQMLELEFDLSDEDVNNYFVESVKVGDLLKVSAEVVNRPNYTDEVSTENKQVRKTLKGKIIGNNEGSTRRNFDGYISKIEIVDVDIDLSTPKKYTREEIRTALEEVERVQNKVVDSQSDEDDGDLPF
jgi:hypothetical protein